MKNARCLQTQDWLDSQLLLLSPPSSPGRREGAPALAAGLDTWVHGAAYSVCMFVHSFGKAHLDLELHLLLESSGKLCLAPCQK